MPLLLLSGIFLPLTLGPGWLQGIARISPFRYIIDAMREAYLGRPGATSEPDSRARARVRAAQNFARAVNGRPPAELRVRPNAVSPLLSLAYNDPVTGIKLDFFLTWEDWDTVVHEADLQRRRNAQEE